jgi:triacylglycerol lipase
MSTLSLVDPELRVLLEAFPTVELSDELLPELRAAERGMVLPVEVDPAAAAAIEHVSRTIPGPAGGPDVGVEIYRPREGVDGLPCIFHIHGGGYVGGFAALLEPLHVPLAHDLGCVIVSVDYRLAPETPFPGPIEDCYAALAWVAANPAELGIDAGRIGVMGESAGGGLAAALALLARDRGGPRLCFQHLIYPMLDDRTCVRDDRNPHTGEFIWTPHNNRFGWTALLGMAPGSDGVSPYAAAARAEDLSGLPSAFISTAALDLFLEEDVDYARRLARHGVPVELHVYPGAFHGFDLAPQAQVARAARRDSREALRRALQPSPPS